MCVAFHAKFNDDAAKLSKEINDRERHFGRRQNALKCNDF